ncbi:hypothetical protein BHM03_00039507 [Ensete ventricosum]|uniref:Uncharacterized protein n=1 Tax=Ensete ventricosum TaxID=4639 RepID=A0A445MKH6_ENSVE|nr:hypothetical protein BHM03_00039507 [Ensete ventricosum]
MERSTPRSPRLTISYRSSTVRRGIKEAHLKMPQSFPQHGTKRSHVRIRAPLPYSLARKAKTEVSGRGPPPRTRRRRFSGEYGTFFRRRWGGFSAGGEDEERRRGRGRGRTGSEQCGKGRGEFSENRSQGKEAPSYNYPLKYCSQQQFNSVILKSHGKKKKKGRKR